MSNQQTEFTKIIKLFWDNDCLQHLILIGSWAEYVYQQTGILPKGTTALRTLDIDFLIKNLKKPNPPISIPKLAEQSGYVVEHDRLTDVTKIRTGSRLELEFIISQKGKGVINAYVLHKIIINDKRKESKQKKDADSILAITPCLDKDRVADIMDTLSKKEIKKVNTFFDIYNISFENS